MLLNDRHFTHDFLSNVNLDAKRLAKYRVFIVNSAQSLADLEVAAMLAFAKNGGTLLLTARTGIKDGNANVRPEWAFAKAFGGLQPKFDKNIQFMKMELGGKTYAFDAPVMGIIMEVTVPEGVRAIGQVYAKNDPAARPLAYETRYGKGRILYTPIEFGNTIWIPEQNIGKSLAGVRYPVCESAANALYDLALVGQNTWDPGDTPEAVLTGIFEVDGKLAIHFLNATGSHLKPGETIPTAMKTPVFPPLANDITFAVARKATKAYAVSPDYDGKRALECKPLPGGKTQIRLPKELLKAYTIVYIE
jgi:hypothetical protein